MQIVKHPNNPIPKFIGLFVYSFIGLFIIGSLVLFSPPTASAITMLNDNWIIQMGTMNSGSGKPTNANYKLGVTVGQTAPGLYSGTNYKVRSGFQYISSIIRFRFSITNLVIDFGILSPTTPVIRTSTLTITNGSSSGYSVTAYENHELLVNASGALIPNTTCDDGACTTTTASTWTNTLTYGFGYRCDDVSGTNCPSSFTANKFKQFADNSKSQTPIAVMQGTNVGRSLQSTITYKVNVSATQVAGLYSNVITYVATPTF